MKIYSFSSGGNDSVALVQFLKNCGKDGVCVVYNDTQWGSREWATRVLRMEEWVVEIGYEFVSLPSDGMVSLVKRKKAWPMAMKGGQFCTEQLKIIPSLKFLDSVDPKKEAVVCVGIRREESRSRTNWPEIVESSDKHGGRTLWSPLVRHTASMRDELIKQTPFDVLPHRSQECHPCIYAGKSDLKLLNNERIIQIDKLEKELGYTKKGHLRTMFRPYTKSGAYGIKEAVRWAFSGHGKYEKPSEECDSGYCGG